MRLLVAALIAAATLASAAQADEEKGALLPFVGCAQYETWGSPPLAEGHVRRALHVDPAYAGRLAWYESDSNTNVVAPRGWHCLEVRDSDHDSTFIVSEQPYSLADFQARKPVSGPAVVSLSISDVGAKHQVIARVVSRYFRKDFAQWLRHSGVGRLAPYPNDALVGRNAINQAVAYETPANRTGLGTEDILAPGPLPIVSGVHFPTDEEGNPAELMKLEIRLPLGSQDLLKPLFEQDSGLILPAKP
ncbi:MAG TPA: hypothetical protein VGG48_14345 [Rhizomicrobium sp.]